MSRPLSGGRTKALLLLSLSMVASAVAIMIVLGIVKRAEQKVADAQLPPDTVTAVVAARDLNVGVTIGPEDVVLAHLIPSVLPESGTFTTVEELVGRTPRERVLANEVVREGRLASADAGIGLNAIIEPGMRAMSVEVDSQSGVAGLIRPGNYVDVIVTIRPDNRDTKAKWVAHNFLQGAKVLAVGRSMGSSEEGRVPEARPTSTREKPGPGHLQGGHPHRAPQRHRRHGCGHPGHLRQRDHRAGQRTGRAPGPAGPGGSPSGAHTARSECDLRGHPRRQRRRGALRGRRQQEAQRWWELGARQPGRQS
jgi:Flp pilus assembly protein CpaB